MKARVTVFIRSSVSVLEYVLSVAEKTLCALRSQCALPMRGLGIVD